MPSPSSRVEVVCKASDLSTAAWQALNRIPFDANIILPTLNKCVELDKRGQSPPGHLWITVYSKPDRVALVLSCTDGYMGQYPVFIVNPNTIDEDDFFACIDMTVLALQRHVCVERVYSVFGPIRIVQSFSRTWTRLTGVQPEAQPYYDAKLSCLRQHKSLLQSVNTSQIFEVGLAVPADILAIAKLCRSFANDCPPFTLTEEAALMEARKLVSSKQIWTHKFNGRVVSIAAFTRNTRQVATITKVYTDPNFWKHGCAERLVRQLCNSLLQDKGREAVVLFVGCDNWDARMYHRVGFHGLGDIANGSAVDNANRWLEVGFDRNKVTLGHW